MPSRKPDSGRREKRQLVRWDVDHDIMLLLTIQQVCNAQGIKLPWKEIAEVMGPKFSEGAIIQHLAKLRLRRLNEGKKVPPPLRRSVVGSTGGRGQVISSERTNKDSKRKPGSRNKKRRGSSDESENEDEMSSAESSDVDDPSYSQRSSKKDRAKKRFKLSSGNKDRTSSANRDKRGVGASPFASNDEDSCDFDESDTFQDEHEDQDEQSTQQSPNFSKVVRLQVPPVALDRLERTGAVKEHQVTTETFQCSPPSWPLDMPSPHEQFQPTLASAYTPMTPVMAQQDAYSAFQYQSLSHPPLGRYQQPSNFNYINPGALSSPSISHSHGDWIPTPSYSAQYPAAQMSASCQDWVRGHDQTPSWESAKHEVSDDAEMH